MAAKDTYTAAQAAELLGVSERRIRQLVAEGKLPGDRAADGTVHIAQQAVNDERKRRRQSPRARASKAVAPRSTTRRAANASVDVDALADAVASAVGQKIEGQLEITRRAESLVRGELDEERARRMEAEAKLAEAERRVTELQSALEAAQARGLFRRRRPT
ncbi:MAG TPA: helix-turn-helix domain-containing protein [Acidimicrobiales bacterium]|nr:helix-turn-helix domain-containing protein [Acidimicrobiales bacterium]